MADEEVRAVAEESGVVSCGDAGAAEPVGALCEHAELEETVAEGAGIWSATCAVFVDEVRDDGVAEGQSFVNDVVWYAERTGLLSCGFGAAVGAPDAHGYACYFAALLLEHKADGKAVNAS